MLEYQKKHLCVICAKLKGTDKKGYIECPEFTRTQAKKDGMTILLHCFCSECEPRN